VHSEFILVKVIKLQSGGVQIIHALNTVPAPVECDHLYIFVGKWGAIAMCMIGDFNKQQLINCTHNILNRDFASHNAKLETYTRDYGSDNQKVYAYTLKGGEK